MQAADNVELGHRLRPTLAGNTEILFQGHGVSTIGLWLAPKSAQTATGYAKVRRIYVAVHVEIRPRTMQFLSHMVGEPTDSQQIERAIERYTVLKAQAFFCQNLLGNW